MPAKNNVELSQLCRGPRDEVSVGSAKMTDEPQSPPSQRLGVPRESEAGERRVAVVPLSIAKLRKFGFDVVVQSGAGVASGYSDDEYRDAGATIGSEEEAWACPVVVKIAPPSDDEIGKLTDDALIASMLDPLGDKPRVERLAKAGVNALALDRVPRISRAQKMDVLSSMANIAGYRAVLEAAVHYEGFFGASVTAAGTIPPAKVLIIGAGVAGLQAIAAARSLGAEVRAFDVRPATAEQVESLGGKFLMLDFDESGEGEGGYAKIMSKEFIDAEMALFAEQAREVDVIITTALIPGRKAPILITTEMVESMKEGSVVVDLAAEKGGNCEVTQPGEYYQHGSVHILGFTDLTSRMARTASRFFSGNVVHLLGDMWGDDGFGIDLEDEVVRGALQTHNGEILPPPPRKPPPPKSDKSQSTSKPAQNESRPATSKKKKKKAQESGGGPLGGLLVMAVFTLIGVFAPASFIPHFTVFVLACFIGWQVVWSVSAALHTPLMSVTNAISGIILVGGMLQAGRPMMNDASAASSNLQLSILLGAIALFFASINIAGGFLVTGRMLKMFQKGNS